MDSQTQEPSAAGIEPLRAALDAFRAQNHQEALDVRRIRELARARGADPWTRDSPLHVTGSALVVHPGSQRVLLRWHARLGSWAQVGGHADPGETDPWHIALREAREETGLDDLAAWPAAGSGLVQVPIQIVIVPVAAHGKEPAHEHADIRYLFSTERPELAAAESPGTPVRWLSIGQALEQVAEDNLREVLVRAGALLASRS